MMNKLEDYQRKPW